MKLSSLYIIAASAISTVCAASIRGSRNLSPFEVPHASSVHKKRSSENIAEQPEETEESSEDGPMSPGLMQTRIIGGGVTNSARFPYAVSIQDSIGHFCGGSLIAADMILTAAHCQGGSYDVVIGRHNLNSNSGESISMAQEFPYPGYNDKNTDGDWMLVKLDRATNQNVPFVKLNYDASKPSPGQEVTVMGWGDTTADDMTQELADKLLSVTVNAISNDECDNSKGSIGGWSEDYHGQITDNMLCAKDNGEDSCQGDSGGPLVILGSDPKGADDVQVGVVSWGIGCASQDFPGVYARVSQVTDWIKNTVCSESSQPPAELCEGGSPSTFQGDDAPATDDTPSDDADDYTPPPPPPSQDDDDDDVSFYTDDQGDDSTSSNTAWPTWTPTTGNANAAAAVDDVAADGNVITDDSVYDDDDSTTPWPTWAPTTDPATFDAGTTDDNTQGNSPTDVSNFGAVGGNWVTIIEDDFANDFGFFTSGGADAKWLSDKKERTGIIDLQDGNGESSSVYSNSIDSSYSKYRVVFDAYLLSMEDDKSFCFDISSDGGSQWTETQCWSGLDLPSKVWHNDMAVEFTPPSNAIDLRVRFRCVGTGNQDDVFIDKVLIEGQ